MPQTLADWQAAFFAERVEKPNSGHEGAYFREQVFGALEVLSGALPELEAAVGEQNFRYFVRELLRETQPTDAMGTSLVEPLLSFLQMRPELSDHASVLELVHSALARARANSAPR